MGGSLSISRSVSKKWFVHLPVGLESREVILQEADYLQEAENLACFHERVKEREGLRVPRPYREYSKKSVLVMEFMEGRKLDEALGEMERGPRRDELLLRWTSIFPWMFFEHQELHIDPHPGNFLLNDQDELVILDFGSVKKFRPEFTDGFLDILDACWRDESARAIELYFSLGYYRGKSELDPDLLREYHSFFLAPFLEDQSFAFGTWTPGRDAKSFMMRHPSFLQLIPPAEALPYFRVLSGIKGFLAKMEGEINVCKMAKETARRRGRLSGE